MSIERVIADVIIIYNYVYFSKLPLVRENILLKISFSFQKINILKKTEGSKTFFSSVSTAMTLK